LVQVGNGAFCHRAKIAAAGAQRQARLSAKTAVFARKHGIFDEVFAKKWLEAVCASGSLCGLMWKTKLLFRGALALILIGFSANAFAGDADINLPPLQNVSFLGGKLGGHLLLFLGLAACAIGGLFGIFEFVSCRAMPVHKSMNGV